MATKIMAPIKQAAFVAKHESLWVQFDQICAIGRSTNDASVVSQAQNYGIKALRLFGRHKHTVDHYPLVALYRQICEHYALAKQRNYSPALIEALRVRVVVGHQIIYQAKKNYRDKFLQFVIYDFPNCVRAYRKLFWLSFTIFYAPYLIVALICFINPDFVYSVISSSDVNDLHDMYHPVNSRIGRTAPRAADSDVMMFGYYIKNNIGISFQMYGMGIFFGLGTIAVTIYNGVVIGAISGYLTGIGFGGTFWSFVAGHSAFELTGLVIAAMAGMRLAMPLLACAPYNKKDALVFAAKQSVQLILGASLMIFIAAFIEAFWSAQVIIPNFVKYMVGLGSWVFVAWYLLFCGKHCNEK